MKNRCIILAISVCLMFFGISSAASAKALYSYPDLFEEVVEIVEEHFYNPAQINQDFPAIKDAYRKQLPQVSTRKAFSVLVNAMLRELNASHTYYLTPEDYEYYQFVTTRCHQGSLAHRIA